MDIKEVIYQLESLQQHCEDMAKCDDDGECEWGKDVKALGIAIDTLKGTAQEVPVQEQYVLLCDGVEIARTN